MGNCVACVNKNEKGGKKDFDGLSTNDNKAGMPRVSHVSELQVNKDMFILTNDGKFSDKYSMGNLLG